MGSRATVASGIPPAGPLTSGGITLLCIAAVLLGSLLSWRQTGPASADVEPHGTPLCTASQSRTQRRPQAGLAHPPEVHLHPVDQRHRDLVPVVAHVVGRGGDVAFFPADAELTRHPLDHRARVVAEVAARPGQQGDPARGRGRFASGVRLTHATYRRSVGRTRAAGAGRVRAATAPGSGPDPAATPRTSRPAGMAGTPGRRPGASGRRWPASPAPGRGRPAASAAAERLWRI